MFLREWYRYSKYESSSDLIDGTMKTSRVLFPCLDINITVNISNITFILPHTKNLSFLLLCMLF